MKDMFIKIKYPLKFMRR